MRAGPVIRSVCGFLISQLIKVLRWTRTWDKPGPPLISL